MIVNSEEQKLIGRVCEYVDGDFHKKIVEQMLGAYFSRIWVKRNTEGRFEAHNSTEKMECIEPKITEKEYLEQHAGKRTVKEWEEFNRKWGKPIEINLDYDLQRGRWWTDDS